MKNFGCRLPTCRHQHVASPAPWLPIHFISQNLLLAFEMTSSLLSMLNKVSCTSVAVLLAIFNTTAQGSPDSQGSPNSQVPLKVLSTVNILESTVRSIACCDIQSSSLMGVGVDPHLYKATARDLSKIRESHLIFAVGLNLEGRLNESLKKLSNQGTRVKFVGESLPKERLFEGDPHVWFDPELWQKVGDSVAEELILLRPQNTTQIQHNLEQWKLRIQKLAQEAKSQFQKLPQDRRILITSHDAFKYFGRFFGLEVYAVQGISTDSEASLKHMDELRKLIVQKKVPAIFVESSVSRMSIERLVEATGTRIGGELYSDSLGPQNSLASSYEGMLRHNTQSIYEALK